MIKFDFYGLTEKEKKDFKKLKTIEEVREKVKNMNDILLLENKNIQIFKIKVK